MSIFCILYPYHVSLCVGLKPICGQLSRICATRRWWQFWARCCVLTGFGQDQLQPVCGWHAQSLARLSGGHRVQTMTNPDPNQADQMGPSDWLWRKSGQHFSRGNNKYTAMAMWLLHNFFIIIHCRYYPHLLYRCTVVLYKWPRTSIPSVLKWIHFYYWKSQLPY